jgi:hypothetical protein
VAASQKSPLNMLRCVKPWHYILLWPVISNSGKSKEKTLSQAQSNKKPPFDKLYYQKPVR